MSYFASSSSYSNAFLVSAFTISQKRRILTKQVKAYINNSTTGLTFQLFSKATHRISLFSYEDRLARSQISRFVYKAVASCWDFQDFYIGKTKRRLRDRKKEHFKLLHLVIIHLLLPNMSRQLVIT